MHVNEALVGFGTGLLSPLVVLQVRVCALLPVGDGVEIEVVRRMCIWIALSLQGFTDHPASTALAWSLHVVAIYCNLPCFAKYSLGGGAKVSPACFDVDHDNRVFVTVADASLMKNSQSTLCSVQLTACC